MTSNCIHQNVNIGQWELVFRASLIEILKIYSNSYLAAFLLYKNYISQPIWTFNFFYKSCPQKLIHFSFNFIESITVDIKYLSIFPIINSIPNPILHTITGNMLGDGSISLSKFNKGEGIYSMTMDVYSLNYLQHLNENIYSQFTNTKFYPYPNILLPQHKGKEITQYHFKTNTHPLFTALHGIWYKYNEKNKRIKIVPLNISEMFSEISLAYWIMDDGYFDSYGRTKTVLLCTESFTREECLILQSLLEKLNIKSTLKIRNKINNRYRIRISKTSMDRVISLVKPYMHKDFLYKLGI